MCPSECEGMPLQSPSKLSRLLSADKSVHTAGSPQPGSRLDSDFMPSPLCRLRLVGDKVLEEIRAKRERVRDSAERQMGTRMGRWCLCPCAGAAPQCFTLLPCACGPFLTCAHDRCLSDGNLQSLDLAVRSESTLSPSSTSPADVPLRGRDRPNLQIKIPAREASVAIASSCRTALEKDSSSIEGPSVSPSRLFSARRIIDGVGRLVRTPKAIVRSASRKLHSAPLSPELDVLSAWGREGCTFWLQLSLDHDLQTLVNLTGNGTVDGLYTAIRLDLATALDINPRRIEVVSVRDASSASSASSDTLAGGVQVEVVVSLPGLSRTAQDEDDWKEHMSNIGRALNAQV
jgi:hypothetical protein